MRSKLKKEYLKLVEANPSLNELVKTFGLTLPSGEGLPDVEAITDIRFSLFWREGDNTKNTTPRKEISFTDLVNIIQSKWIKELPKKQRPYITPYGTFTERNNEGLKQFNTNLIALDFDKLNDEKLNYLKLFWKGQRNTVLSLVSPSKNGLKVIIRAKHTFEPNDLYKGLKLNSKFFVTGGIEPDLMQFVLSQPLFIPYAEEPYFNPYAELKDYGFESLPEVEIIENKAPIQIVDSSRMNRVNTFFKNRVEMYLSNLENRPLDSGTHSYLYSTIKRIYPYINQQTVYSEAEITERLESIVVKRYGNRQELKSLYRSIALGRTPEESLKDLINRSAKVKI